MIPFSSRVSTPTKSRSRGFRLHTARWECVLCYVLFDYFYLFFPSVVFLLWYHTSCSDHCNCSKGLWRRCVPDRNDGHKLKFTGVRDRTSGVLNRSDIYRKAITLYTITVQQYFVNSSKEHPAVFSLTFVMPTGRFFIIPPPPPPLLNGDHKLEDNKLHLQGTKRCRWPTLVSETDTVVTVTLVTVTYCLATVT